MIFIPLTSLTFMIMRCWSAYKYSHVNPGIEAKFLKEALGLLGDARCLSKICHASGAGAPLLATTNERKFKIAFLDVGLMQNALGVQDSIILDNSIMQINAGSVAEQYVAQELLACADPYSDKKLHFWAREARGSNAEVDFLIEIEGMPIPVEVKAGARGSLKSMRLFLKEYPKTLLGVRYSMHELSYVDQILSIPLYMISQTQRLVRASLVSNHMLATNKLSGYGVYLGNFMLSRPQSFMGEYFF